MSTSHTLSTYLYTNDFVLPLVLVKDKHALVDEYSGGEEAQRHPQASSIPLRGR